MFYIYYIFSDFAHLQSCLCDAILGITIISEEFCALQGGISESELWFEAEAYPPTEGKITLDYGDNSSLIFETFELNRRYTHQYIRVGEYHVTANISNIMNWLVVDTRIFVIVPVTGFDIKV